MAIAVKSGPITPADELRSLLTRSEDRVVAPGGPAGVAELFAWLDQLADLWPSLRATGVDLRAEQARWESLQGAARERAPQLLKAWGGERPLIEARQAMDPEPSHWWWWIDQLVSANRRRRLTKILGVVTAIVIVVALSAFLLAKLFPVDPKVRETYRLQGDAETALLNGDLPAAREALQQAVAISPDNENLQVTYGVVAEALGDQGAAEAAWSQARSLLGGDEARFLTLRSQAYGAVGQPQKTIADAAAALTIDPNSALAYFTLGGGYEQVGDLQKALDAYTKASELAGDDNPQLVVLSKTRMASLLQRIPYAPTAEPLP